MSRPSCIVYGFEAALSRDRGFPFFPAPTASLPSRLPMGLGLDLSAQKNEWLILQGTVGDVLFVDPVPTRKKKDTPDSPKNGHGLKPGVDYLHVYRFLTTAPSPPPPPASAGFLVCEPSFWAFFRFIQACHRLAASLGDEFRPHELSLYLKRLSRRKEHRDVPRFVPAESRAL